MRSCLRVVLLAALSLSSGAPSQAPGSSQATVNLEVRDLTPNFLAFYAAATKEHADEARRWELWQKMYGFAAVPPGPEGEVMARKMLDESWPKYAGALTAIRRGATGLSPEPTETLQAVAKLLDADQPIHAKLVVFVGDFDGNAFTAPGAGQPSVPTVAVPVEGMDTGLVMTHEFTHVVEAEQAGLSLEWQRTIAHTIFAEGLAMRTTQRLHPGLAAEVYVGEFTPDWIARAESKRAAILADIAPHLGEDSSDAVMKYTMGVGGAGIDREAYYAGWLVIGEMLDSGWTFPQLARVRDADMVKLVAASLARLELR